MRRLMFLALFVAVLGARQRTNLNFNWKFSLGDAVHANCTANDFPIDYNDKQCLGLNNAAYITNYDDCRAECCGNPACDVFQWCPDGSTDCNPAASCWYGKAGKCDQAKGWQSRGRTPPPPPPPSPNHNKCLKPQCDPHTDDSGWRVLDLPHDYVLEGNFTSKASKVHGYLPFNTGWYRYHLSLDKNLEGQVVWLDFDGTYRDSQVYLNGFLLGTHPSGYTSYRFYIGKGSNATINWGGDNLLAVYTDATQPEGWWYDGGGIYRSVWLNSADPLYIEPWGVYLPTSIKMDTITWQGLAAVADTELMPETVVINARDTGESITVKTQVLDSTGKEMASTESTADIPAGANVTVKQSVAVHGVQLWSADTPVLYTVVSTILTHDSASVDVVETRIGFRDIVFDANKGLILNGKVTKIKGMANHQDFAGVGTAVPDPLQSYRIRKLKEMGGNAWRTAHNPPTPALLDAADSLGFLVWDENHKNDLGPSYMYDIRALVLRDRNHPSVIMWSLCNEVLCEGFNADHAKVLKGIVKELDPLGGRPVTAAMNGGYTDPFTQVLDVMGINYHIGNYDGYHKDHPHQPMIGSETSSAVSDRGIYFTDKSKARVSAYDVNYPGWGETAEVMWCAVNARDFISGSFTWTGFDYKGEPTPYGWPNVNSHFGVIDIAGFPKDLFHYYRSMWNNTSMVHLFPHWNWQSGDTVDVWVFTNLPTVELLLNGKAISNVTVEYCNHAEWKVPFSNGTLEARGYDKDGALVTSASVATTGEARKIHMEVEYPSRALTADNVDVALITVTVTDAEGRVVPTADVLINFSLDGQGRIIGLGNGDPNCHEHDRPATITEGARTTFNGFARVILQSTLKTGSMTLKATAASLTSSTLSVPVN